MNHPLISEYLEAIKSAEENFEELTNLRPVLDDDGQPVMTSGNFAVVFKMKDTKTGKFYALKCFTKEQEGRVEAYHQIADALKDVNSPYLVSLRYLDKELFVDTEQTAETEFPVLLMDWVEGKTLDKYLRENLDDKYALEMLAYRFSQLAQWLIPQPFAHGDLKPDNIIVREDCTLVLVDYDGMYVPAMKGQRSRELGSPDFRHPSRTEETFDEHIDDFSIASILLSLKAIALKPSLLMEFGTADKLLFTESDYRNLSECKLLDALKLLMPDTELATLYALFILAAAQGSLSQVSFRIINLSRPDRSQYEEENLSTEVIKGDYANAWIDKYGVYYSEDKKRLLGAPENLIGSYSIYNSTKVICGNAFYECGNLASIFIPQSVSLIGTSAFEKCSGLISIHIPNSVTSIGACAFMDCSGLTSIHIPDGVTSIENSAFAAGSSLSSIHIPDSVTSIGSGAFRDCSSLTSVYIPDSVTSIGGYAFSYCSGLTSIHIPDGVTSIGEHAFRGCSGLTSIHIPDSVTSIGDSAFSGCSSLMSIYIPDKVTGIGICAFSGCSGLTSIHIPDGVISIGGHAFSRCSGLTSIHIPNSVTSIGENAFYACKKLASIRIPDSVTSIRNWTFRDCSGLSSIHIPDSVTSIGGYAFLDCSGLTSIRIPDSVTSIGYDAFRGCSSLTSIRIPNSVTSIGDSAFSGCSSLTSIYIPDSVTGIGNWLFWDCENLASIFIPYGTRTKFEEMLWEYKDKLKET